MISQKGFTQAKIILIVAILIITTGVGYFVYRAQSDTKKILDKVANTSNELYKSEKVVKNDEKVASQKEENSWLLFTPENKTYSVRVPDGWSAVSINGNLYVRDADKLVYAQGTKAVIDTSEFGWDGGSPFSLTNPGSYYDQIVRQGTETGVIKTDSGITAHKFVYIEQNEPEAIGYAKGTKVYNYYFDADGKYIQVTHAIAPGNTDQSELIERLIKTITVK